MADSTDAKTADLLFEIRTEEIPAGYLDRAVEALARDVQQRLAAAHVAHGDVVALATPRRLALFVAAVTVRQPDRTETAVGPAEKAAFTTDGEPTKAAQGFARGQGVDVGALEVRDTPKGRYVCVEKRVDGIESAALLPEVLRDAVAAVPFPKRMRWVGKALTFARPIRGVLALFGTETLDLEIAGVRATNETHGHRFLAPDAIGFDTADLDAYRSRLDRAFVVVDGAARRQAVKAGLDAAAEAAGGTYRDDGLVAEVTNMVEYPGVLTASFDERFLELPDAVIEAVLRNHQRYFSIAGADGALTNRFLSVVDRAEGFDRIRDGNERVVRARLVDAEFFLAEDSKRTLADRREALDNVVFLKGLGTMGQRVERIAPLARKLAVVLWGQDTAALAERAAGLAKCDLTTQMVFEFPELQGVIGEHYARRIDGEPTDVAAAIREHYRPQGPDDDLPSTPTGLVVALADRIDLLTGCFLKGLEPTGSRDPFGLRRAALGVIRLVRSAEVSLDLRKWLEIAAQQYRDLVPEARAPEEPLDRLGAYLRERIVAHFIDRGDRHELVHAAAETGWSDVRDLERRLDALGALASDERFPQLVELVERTKNIAKALEREEAVRPSLFTEEIERQVHDAFVATEPLVRGAFESGDYEAGSWRYLDGLGGLLARYFDEVYVNVEDARVRTNRLSMLRAVHRLYRDHVADLSLVPRAS